MNRKSCIVLALLLAVSPLAAQEADGGPWQWHVSTGSSVASGFGRTQSLTWVAPSFEYHATPRLTLSGGFAAAGSLLPDGFKLQGRSPVSLAPLRQGTRMNAMWAAARYQVNDRLLVWGSVAHLGGQMQPLWLDHSMPLQTTAYSGGFAYSLSHKSLLEVHFHIIKDNSPMGFISPISPIGHISPIDHTSLFGPLDL